MQPPTELLARRLRRLLRLNFDGSHFLLVERSSIRVQAQHDLLVLQRVLLLHAGALGARAALDGAHHGLHLGAVDQAADVRVGDQVRGEEEVLFEIRGRRRRAVDVVEGREGG